MRTSEMWLKRIEQASAEKDPARCNRMITELHYALSESLAEGLGRGGGPNFHSWAVWGSRKAGVTIRQEDLDSAIGNATKTAGVTGAVVGIAVGVIAGIWWHWQSSILAAALGSSIGAVAGAWTGKKIAIWSRERAAALILEGNRTVLRDIGEQSGRFIELLEGGATAELRSAFFAGLRSGDTENGGQDRLAAAFRCYLAAFEANTDSAKRRAMIEGNCAVVYHEHIRLEPFIRGAMPFIVRRCATQRMMTFEIGDKVLAVGEDLPGSMKPTAARNWARIEDRMRYVFALFDTFHDAPEVFSRPYGGA